MSVRSNPVFELMIHMTDEPLKSTSIRCFDSKSYYATDKLIKAKAFGRVSYRRFLWKEITPSLEADVPRFFHMYIPLYGKIQLIEWGHLAHVVSADPVLPWWYLTTNGITLQYLEPVSPLFLVKN